MPKLPKSFTDNLDQFSELVQNGALVFCNHSGGKDSQAMYLILRQFVPRSQLIILHADLGIVEHAGVKEHIRNTTDGLPLHIALKFNEAGDQMSLLEKVEERGMWFDHRRRWCTSDFKTAPCNREIGRIAKKHFPNGNQVVITCLGLRAQESTSRAEKASWRVHDKLTTKTSLRRAYEFLPVQSMTEEEVFELIDDAGQEPHPAYAEGYTRLSCQFCIFQPARELQLSARRNPKLAQAYVDLEARINHTFKPTQSLAEIVGIQPNL